MIVSLSNGGLIVGDGVAASLSAPLHRWGVRSPDLRSRIVIVVDDGLVEASAACQALRTMRSRAPTRLVFAVPVAVREALAVVRSEVDLAIALQLEQELDAVSDRYMRFPTVDDAAAAAIVDRARNRLSESPTRRTRALTSLPPPSC